MSKFLWVNQEMNDPQAPSVVDSQICTGCCNDVKRIFLAGLCLLEGRGPKGSGFLVQTEILRLGLGERHLDPPLAEGMEKSEDLNALVCHRRCGPQLSLTKVINHAVELHRKHSML